MTPGPFHYLLLSGLLMALGAATVLLRRNAILMFMGVEVMLNSANLAFVAFSRYLGSLEGQAVALFSMVVAAAEVVVGLALIVAVVRHLGTASADELRLLRR